MSIVNILVAVILLIVLVAIFITVSYFHKKDGLRDVCTGNCSSCAMAGNHGKDCQKEDNKR